MNYSPLLPVLPKTNHRIALFGTSADPPTAGHQEICHWLGQHYDWVAVWASDNPFKSHQTPLAHRSTMLKLLLEDLRSPGKYGYSEFDSQLDSRFDSRFDSGLNSRNAVLNIDLYQELSSPRTLETITKARQLWGDEPELTLVIGADLISQLPRWYRLEDLLQQVQILVIPRSGYPLEEQDLQELKSLGGRVAIARVHPPGVSSTDYRNSGDDRAITPPVAAYISQENLYPCQNLA